MRVSGGQLKTANAIAAAPAENTPSDALFAAILAGAADQKVGKADEPGSAGALSQQDASSQQDQPSPENTPAPPSEMLRTAAGRLDLLSALFGRIQAAQPARHSPGQSIRTIDAEEPAELKSTSGAKRTAPAAANSDHSLDPNATPVPLPIVPPAPQIALPVTLPVLPAAAGERTSSIQVEGGNPAPLPSQHADKTNDSAEANAPGQVAPQPHQDTTKPVPAELASPVHAVELTPAVPPSARPEAPAEAAATASPAASRPACEISLVPAPAHSSQALHPGMVMNVPLPQQAETMPAPPQTSSTSPSPASVKPANRNSRSSQTGDSAQSAGAGDQSTTSSTSALQDPPPAARSEMSAAVHIVSQQAAPHPGAAHDTAPAGRPAAAPLQHATFERMEAAANGDLTASLPAPGVNTAKLMQSLQQTEMRVGMHSAEFGQVSIRGQLSQQQVVAQISAAHSELAKAISDHLPSLQARLHDYGVRATVEVSQSAMSFSGGQQHASPQDQKPRSPGVPAAAMVQADQDQPTTRFEYARNDGRIDIRA